jgi:hypothetical protein
MTIRSGENFVIETSDLEQGVYFLKIVSSMLENGPRYSDLWWSNTIRNHEIGLNGQFIFLAK